MIYCPLAGGSQRGPTQLAGWPRPCFDRRFAPTKLKKAEAPCASSKWTIASRDRSWMGVRGKAQAYALSSSPRRL
jgi:hypothetical protein